MAALVAIRKKRVESPGHSVTASFIQTKEIQAFLTRDEIDAEALKKASYEMQEQRNDSNCLYRKELRDLYEHDVSQLAVAMIIVLNFIAEAMGAQVKPKKGSPEYSVFIGLEMFFTIFFAIELMWNMYGTWFFLFWTGPNWGWNLFDFIVVVISFMALIFPNLPGITVLRLFRAFRVARLFKRIPSLRKIIEGVLKAIPGLLQMGSVLLIFLGIWSVIGVQFYSDIAEKEFGTFTWAMYTMAKAMLGEFVLTSDKLMYTYDRPEAALFFYSFIFIVGIVLMNVVVAILLENYLDYQEGPADPGSNQSGKKHVFEEGYPTLYVRQDGILNPIRSVSYEQLEKIQEMCLSFPPPGSEDREYSDFSDQPVEDWDTTIVVKWIRSIGFKDFEDKFTEGNINGKLLMILSTFDMHQLGMKFGRQMEFSLQVQKLVAHQTKRVKKLESMKQAFEVYDEDNSGYLDREEFKIAWKKIYNKQNVVLSLTRKVSDGIGNTIRGSPPPEPEMAKEDVELDQDLEAIFDMLDLYGDGKISLEEFIQGNDLMNFRTGIRRKRKSSGYFGVNSGLVHTPSEALVNSITNQMGNQTMMIGGTIEMPESAEFSYSEQMDFAEGVESSHILE